MSINNVKNALVTGGAKRLGREIAIALAKDGWNVAVHHNSTPADEVVKEIEELGRKAVAIKADLVNFAEVRNTMAQASSALGKISLLINSASRFEHVKFMDSEENTYDAHMDVHVKAPFFLSQEFARQCQNGGQIINIIDSSVTQNDGGHFAYFLSKKALRALSKMMAKQLAPGILINAIFPGAIEEFSDNVSKEFLELRKNKLPMKKFVTAKEITDTIILLTKTSLTGQEIFVDGGEQLI